MPVLRLFSAAIYATLLPEHAYKFSEADIIIQGEGEACVVETLCSMWNLQKPGLFNIAGLDTLPYPAFDLAEAPYVCIQTSRGCPYRCTYCASKIMNKGFRRRDPIRVTDEIGFWKCKRNTGHLHFMMMHYYTSLSRWRFPS